MSQFAARSAAALALLSLLPGPRAQAQTQTVTLNTSALQGLGTFYVDFTLTDGSQTGDGNSRAVLSDFVLTGGQVGGVLPPTTGDAVGDLGSGLTLSDDGQSVNGSDASSNGTADFAQGFTVTSSASTLVFNLALTSAGVEASAPDTFLMTLLDSNYSPVATTGQSGSEFVVAYFTTPTPVPQGYASTDPRYAPAITATISPAAAPEPSSRAALALGLLGLTALTLRARRRNSSPPPVREGGLPY